MIDDDAVAGLEFLEAGAFLYDDAAGLVAGDHTGNVAFGTFAGVLPVDGADIGTADRTGLCLHKHLSEAGGRNLEFFHLDGAVSGKRGAQHAGGNDLFIDAHVRFSPF